MSAEDAAPAAGNALGKKIGPLPLGVWIGAIALGGGIAWYTSRGARASAATTTDGTEFTDRLDNTQPGAGNLAGLVGSVVDTAASLVSAYTTNEEWQSVALRKLISKGWDPTTADAALRAYVGSQTLTVAQKQAIDDALMYVGPPPVSPSLPASGYIVEPTAGKTATPTQEQQGKDTPTQAPAFLTGIATTWGGANTYTGTLSDGRTVDVNERDVWSGTFSGNAYGTAAGGYSAAEADQIRAALAAKGLATPAGGYSGGYTEESAGGRVQQALGGRSS